MRPPTAHPSSDAETRRDICPGSLRTRRTSGRLTPGHHHGSPHAPPVPALRPTAPLAAPTPLAGPGPAVPTIDPELVELTRRFAAGDEDAIRQLHRRYAGRILASVLPVVFDRSAAEEIVQETFLRAWRRAHTLDTARPIEPWLFRIARNLAIDHVRSAARRPRTAALDPTDRNDRLVDHRGDTDPERAAGRLALRWEVRAAIDDLPAGEREVVRLQHLHGLTHAEVAERLGISVGTVKSRSYRAHRRLAAALAGHRSGQEGQEKEGSDPSASSSRNWSTSDRKRPQAGSSTCRM